MPVIAPRRSSQTGGRDATSPAFAVIDDAPSTTAVAAAAQPSQRSLRVNNLELSTVPPS
jgi:hypothetical protein